MKRLFVLLAALGITLGNVAASRGLAATQADLLPLYSKAGDWLNGTANLKTLSGKVVIVDVFTFGCSNCKNVTPNLRQLHERLNASDFAIVGLHAPETPYEANRANLAENLKLQGITWPVRIDNDFKLWRIYGISAWPTQLIFDRKGHLRKTIVGDSQDAAVNATVQQLSTEH